MKNTQNGKKVKFEREVRQVIYKDLLWLVSILLWLVSILTIFIIVAFMIYQCGLLVDMRLDTNECERNAVTLIDEPYYDLECYANDNAYEIFEEELICKCFYQAEYDSLGYGTKSKYFDIEKWHNLIEVCKLKER